MKGGESMVLKMFCKHAYFFSRFENRQVTGTRSFGITGVEIHKCVKCGHETEKEVRAKFPRQPPPIVPSKKDILKGGENMSTENSFTTKKEELKELYRRSFDIDSHLKDLRQEREEFDEKMSEVCDQIQEMEHSILQSIFEESK